MTIDFNDFPRLMAEGFDYTSEPTIDYNCIAWAAGVKDQWWWPDEDGTWPEGVPRILEMQSFVKAYGLLGYLPCDDGSYELGIEKIALYEDLQGDPSHAALQIGPGEWTSKIGNSDDITHTLEGLEGPCYGRVVAYLKRPKK